MSANFKIESHENDGNLHIDLAGDFDGNSAWELVNTIILKYNGKGLVFINTEKVGKVIPFGSVVFKNLMTVSILPINKMVFIGVKGSKIGPAGCKVYNKGCSLQKSKYTSYSSIM